MRDNTLVVEVPADILADLVALAGGYRMRFGNFIPGSCVTKATEILYDAGYETWGDEPFPELKDWKYGTV